MVEVAEGDRRTKLGYYIEGGADKICCQTAGRRGKNETHQTKRSRTEQRADLQGNRESSFGRANFEMPLDNCV